MLTPFMFTSKRKKEEATNKIDYFSSKGRFDRWSTARPPSGPLVLEDFHMIWGGCLYKNTFLIIFFPKFEKKNILCMAEKYLV